MKLRWRNRLCARLLGRKPRRCAVSRMRSRVSAVIRPCPFSAFEAVATLTPAAAATSRKVTRFGKTYVDWSPAHTEISI